MLYSSWSDRIVCPYCKQVQGNRQVVPQWDTCTSCKKPYEIVVQYKTVKKDIEESDVKDFCKMVIWELKRTPYNNGEDHPLDEDFEFLLSMPESEARISVFRYLLQSPDINEYYRGDIIRLMARFSYPIKEKEIFEILVSLLESSEINIKDAVVGVLECMEDSRSYEVLKTIEKTGFSWFDLYVEKVKHNMKKKLEKSSI
jgi:hypothetical protein